MIQTCDQSAHPEAGAPGACLRRLAAREIDEPALDVRLDELDRDLLPDVETLEALDQLPLHRRAEDPDPGPFLRDGGDHPLETLPDPRLEEESRGRFPDLPLDFV